jgi:ABC-type nitrate/sulfonate/bicarbonate transport system permease component
MTEALSRKRVVQFVIGTGGVAILWQIASLYFPDYLFPSIPQIVSRFLDIATTWTTQVDILTTAARILAGLVGAFVCGVLMALVLNKSASAEAYLTPVLILLQGIPALSWVVIAVIWFHGTEFRIFFIMLVTTLPAFTFQILDAVRSMSKDLFEMTVAFRPDRWTLFRVLVLPTVVPGILTAWKVNLGNASRVVVVAELVGATGGVGYELLRQQQLFDMAGAIAWTLQLVTFVLVFQGLITGIEAWALRWRPRSERTI